MSQLMPEEVEVLPHPGVPVVPHCSPVLRAPLPTGPCVSDLADILSWLSQALTRSMGAGDIVAESSQVMLCLIGQVWPVKVLVCVRLLVE